MLLASTAYPAQLMFGRSQNTLLPQPAKAFAPIDLKVAAAAKDKAFEEHITETKLN